MKIIVLARNISLLCLCLNLIACKKHKNCDDIHQQAPSPIKSAKFEIVGNYSGQLSVVYSDNVSGNTAVSVASLPWSITIDYPNTVGGIAIGGNSSTQALGAAGQTVTVRIYDGNAIVRSGNTVADVNGIVNLPTLAYTFP